MNLLSPTRATTNTELPLENRDSEANSNRSSCRLCRLQDETLGSYLIEMIIILE